MVAYLTHVLHDGFTHTIPPPQVPISAYFKLIATKKYCNLILKLYFTKYKFFVANMSNYIILRLKRFINPL